MFDMDKVRKMIREEIGRVLDSRAFADAVALVVDTLLSKPDEAKDDVLVYEAPEPQEVAEEAEAEDSEAAAGSETARLEG